MSYLPPVGARHVAATLLVIAATTAQESVRFVPQRPAVRMAIHDLPALLEVLPSTHFGRLFAEPDVAAAWALGQRNYAAKVEPWTRAIDALLKLDATQVDLSRLLEREIFGLDWRDFRSGELVGTRPHADVPYGMRTTVLLETKAEAEGRLAQRFESRFRTASAAHKVGETKVGDHTALLLTPVDEAQHGHGPSTPSAWLLHVPGQFACGDGSPSEVGTCIAAAPPPPGIVLEFDPRLWFDMFTMRAVGNEPGAAEEPHPALAALGFDVVGLLTWSLRPKGELLQDEISFALSGKPGGLLGAFLDGIAPPVDQPLPEGGLMQVRCAVDVRALVHAIDALLTIEDSPTLQNLELASDIEKAWTGGATFALVRPAPGGLVPRMYASFGIADEAALDRLLTRLRAAPDIEAKDVTYENVPSVQLRLPGAPPALQPSYCLRDGTIHFAESGTSLRALLKAAAGGAPPVLDVGDAKRPDGPGAVLPGFDLRFDGAQIHAALQETWLSLVNTAMPLDPENQALVPLDELPGLDVVLPHFVKGRGVLRRQSDRITLAMAGTAGGPELHALLIAYGPMLSAQVTQSWRWQTDSVLQQVSRIKLTKVAESVAAFEKRTGKPPTSLGELLAAGDLADPTLLLVEDDKGAEPVLHEGKEVARSSFRYFANGVKASPQGEEITARLIAIKGTGWQRLLVDMNGSVQEGWGEFVQKPIDDFGK